MVRQKLHWWQLYLLGATAVVLLLAAHFAFADTTARRLVQLGIILIGYRLILVWVGSQSRVLEYEDWAQHDGVADHDSSIAK